MQVLIKPILTEKMTKDTEVWGVYGFITNDNASKIQIKDAVEKKFSVKVKKVRTMNYKGKMKNTSVKSNGKVLRTSGFRSDWKKAIIILSDGYEIDIVGGEI